MCEDKTDMSASDSSVAELQARPYRWGYFQGVALFPWSIFIVLVGIGSLTKAVGEPWPYALTAIAMGILGFPLAFALLRKKKLALPLVHAMLALSILLTAIQVYVAVRHFTSSGYEGSAFFEAEMLLVWLLSVVYYRRRRGEFR
jgi:hypothetical protein